MTLNTYILHYIMYFSINHVIYSKRINFFENHKEKAEGKFGKVAVKLLKDAEILDASTEGGSHQRDRFGVGYSGQLPLDRQVCPHLHVIYYIRDI